MIKYQSPAEIEQQIMTQEVVRSELKQTKPNQIIYERFGGNVFLPVTLDKALSNCENKLTKLHELMKSDKQC